MPSTSDKDILNLLSRMGEQKGSCGGVLLDDVPIFALPINERMVKMVSPTDSQKEYALYCFGPDQAKQAGLLLMAMSMSKTTKIPTDKCMKMIRDWISEGMQMFLDRESLRKEMGP